MRHETAGRQTAFILVYAAGFPYFRGDIYLCTGALHLAAPLGHQRRLRLSGICSRGAAHLALHKRIPVRHACRIPERYRHQLHLHLSLLGIQLHDDRLSADVFRHAVRIARHLHDDHQDQAAGAVPHGERARENACQPAPLGLARHPHAADLHHRFNLGHSGNARPVSRTAASAARGRAR